jgi:hypothetical protein
MLAAYTVIADIWVDMPEAKPRARARVKNNRPDAELIVEDDGTLTFSEDADIEIDTYGGPKYVDIRKEIRLSMPINAFASDKKIISVTGENAPVVKPVKEDRSTGKPATKVGKDK